MFGYKTTNNVALEIAPTTGRVSINFIEREDTTGSLMLENRDSVDWLIMELQRAADYAFGEKK